MCVVCWSGQGEGTLKAPWTKENLKWRTNREDALVNGRGRKVASPDTGGQDPECEVARDEAREASRKQDACLKAVLRVWILS